MDNREVLIENINKKAQYTKIFLISLTFDLAFFIILPLIIYLLGYEEYSNIDWLFIWGILLLIDGVGFLISFGKDMLSKNNIVLKENNKILWLKMDKNINISDSNQVMVGNIIYQNSNNLFSNIIGATLVSSGVNNIYKSIEQNEEVEGIQNFEIKDILSNPFMDYKYYEDCTVIKQNKKYTLYSAKLRKNDGSFVNTKLKISNIYEKVN